MSFAWPLGLLSLVVAPALLGAYWWMLRRRRRQAVRYSDVALLRSVLPKRKRWQRHLPIAALLASLVALALATGRPQVERTVPYARTSRTSRRGYGSGSWSSQASRSSRFRRPPTARRSPTRSTLSPPGTAPRSARRC